MTNPDNVYAGTPDARQQQSTTSPVSRFRPTYRALEPEEKELHDEIKNKAVELETLFQKVSPGRYNSLAMTSLEESIMWIVKELTSNKQTIQGLTEDPDQSTKGK